MIIKLRESGMNRAIRGLLGLLMAVSFAPAQGLDLFPPAVYKLPPEQLEQTRSELGIIGVVVSDSAGEQEILMPAKGFCGGLTRGLATGAALPIAVGLVLPVPGGSIAGALVSPVTAIGGGIYGAATALPKEQVEKATLAIQLAEDELRSMDLHQALMRKLVALGSENTRLQFVALPGIAALEPEEPARHDPLDQYPVESESKEIARYDPSGLSGATDVLEIRTHATGLSGRYTINPQTNLFVELDARLIRVRDNQVLLSESLSCVSEGQRTYTEWALREGQLVVDDFLACVDELAEKIIDDFFLVYPTP